MQIGSRWGGMDIIEHFLQTVNRNLFDLLDIGDLLMDVDGFWMILLQKLII
jgi:hypothetical protein